MADWQGFYSRAQVSRLARVPLRTLSYWKAKGIVAPSIQVLDDSGRVVDEGYSYADLAIAKLLRALRDKQLSLRSVVAALRHLYARFGPPTSPQWHTAHVYVDGRDVFARKPDDWDATLATRAGQKAEMRVLGELTEEEAAILIPHEFEDYVEIDLDVMEGQPVIRDTRVPTFMLATLFDDGYSVREIAALYGNIPQIAIEKAIRFEKSLDETIEPTAAKTRTPAA